MKLLLTTLALSGLLVGVANLVALFSGRGDIGVSLGWTQLLMIVSFAYLLFAQVFPRQMFRAPADQLSQTVRQVRGSGRPLATIRTGGRVGWVEFRGPLLRATAFPAGIVVEPLLLSTFAVLAPDIDGVDYVEMWPGLGQRRLKIAHHSRHVVSPIFLWCRFDHPFVTALRAITPTPPAR